MRILFITATPLGDAILSTGLLMALHKQHPAAKITVACGPVPAPIFKDFPFVDRIIPLKKGPYLRHWRHLWRAVWHIRWHRVVDLRGSLLSYFLMTTRRHRWLSAMRQFPVQTPPAQHHKIYQLAKVLPQAPTLPEPLLLPNLALRQTLETQFGLAPETPLIVIGPTSAWPMKEWPISQYQALMAALSAEDNSRKFLILTGPGDERLRAMPLLTDSRLKDSRLPDAANILDGAGTLSVNAVAALLSRAHLYIGNDSGLMHMAAALGVRTVGLFGPSPDHFYAPWGTRTAFVRTKVPYPEALLLGKKNQNIMAEIALADVMGAVQTVLAAASGLPASRQASASA